VSSLRKIVVALLSSALALMLVATATAAAAATPPTKKPVKIVRPPADTRVARVAIGRTPGGALALLIATRYPIQAAGRSQHLVARFRMKPGTVPVAQAGTDRLSAGPLRRPERRRTFTFVHELDLKPQIVRRLAEAWNEGTTPSVTVEVNGGIDIDGDGKADIKSKSIPRRIVSLPVPAFAARRGGGAGTFCASFPIVRLAPGEHTKIPLPACQTPVRWSLTAGASDGNVDLNPATLEYTAPNTPGTQTIQLSHGTVVVKVVRPWTPLGATAGPSPGSGPIVRAMGDSVTAGFGYYSDGSLMGITSLPECKPFGAVLDDACSSNSTATKNGLKEVPYAPDYGLANNISWAAQWANEYNATNYKNFAISGTEPSEWAPGGSLYPTTRKIEEEDPDYILMTIGANPILSETLFGLSPMQCALESDIFGGYKECVEQAFKKVNLEAELAKLYKNLVENSKATIYVMKYHLSVPASALLYTSTEIAELARLMNETITRVVAEVNSPRLRAIEPPHFNVGVNLAPVYPSTDECHYLGELVDGPSVQSTPSQVALRITNPLTFCGGPEGGGEPWVISGDTGIHPSAAGYAQMASQVPAPAP
jgi:lysophospholipase L1-like esterase